VQGINVCGMVVQSHPLSNSITKWWAVVDFQYRSRAAREGG